MKKARQIVGSIIIFLDKIFPPRAKVRTPAEQSAVNAKVKENLLLYQFEACPFCLKVRRASRRLNLALPMRDALISENEYELIKGGGKRQVPCLRIEEKAGSVQWLYESADIISYLEKSFS